MFSKRVSVLFAIFILNCSGSQTAKETDPGMNTNQEKSDMKLETKRDDITDVIHGQNVADPYRWLEDVSQPEVQEWMKTHDAHARKILAASPGREKLEKRFSELYYVDSISAPRQRGKRFFWSRRHADKEKRIQYWREGENGEEKVLLDPNTMSKDGSISIGTVVPSWDGKTLAYTLKENNADESTLYVMNIDTREVSKTDVIPGAKYASPKWTPDNKGFYYTYLPTDPNIPVADRPGYAEVRFHKLGTDPKTDPVIHEKLGNPEKFIGTDLSRDGRYLFFYVWHGWNATDVSYKDLKRGDKEWKPIVEGAKAQFSILPWKDSFYIVTNMDAPRWRVLKTKASKPDQKNWKEIIPEYKDGSVIDNVQIVGGHLVLTLLSNVYSDLRIHDLGGKLIRDIELPGIGATFGMTGEPDVDDAYFGFQSFTVAPRIYKTSIATGKTSQWADVKVPVDPSPFKVEQVWYPSKDGTKIPMFVITRKDIKLDGSTPFIISGYGGFNVSLSPYFRASIFPWLEAGGGYAIPNLRGGGEFGEDWHKAGMLHTKQNVFDDFIGAAEFLIGKGYTKPEKLAIRGGSNGGLLVGAAMTQRPELFGAVVCAVPLLDMVRYHLFGSGKTWISEYGSADDPEQFKTLYAYSPYHQVKEGTAYPALLMMAADSDDRVDPMHARKFTAAIQHANTSDSPAIIRIEKNSGHGGADLVKQYVASSVDMYGFLMDRFGLSPN